MTKLIALLPLLSLLACDPPPGSKAANTGTTATGNEAAAGGATAGSSSDDTVTMAEYSRVRNGMTYKQTVDIVGFDGTEDSSMDAGGIKMKMYTWTNPDGMAMMNGMYQNGKLTMKTQANLR